MRKEMVYQTITRTFESEKELNELLAANPTYRVQHYFGRQGINVIIYDIRMADVIHTTEGLKINKWL